MTNSTLTHGNRTLSLKGLHFCASLGILPEEINNPQPIEVSAQLNFGMQPLAPQGDAITSVLDYRLVREAIIDTCTQGHVNLLESLSGKVACRLLELPGVIGARVCITKLEIFEDCEVAIWIEAGQW